MIPCDSFYTGHSSRSQISDPREVYPSFYIKKPAYFLKKFISIKLFFSLFITLSTTFKNVNVKQKALRHDLHYLH